ncbi:MAG: hypothetical protein WBB35_15665 [Saprospiraceae bacterium]
MKKIVFSFLLLGVFTLIHAQKGPTVFDCIYETEGIPVIKIETNWNKVINQKMDEEYLPGTIEMPCHGETLKFEIRTRARGNMRKQVCFFPPIKIDFKKGALMKNKLDTATDKLKVVFQCRTGDANSELLMREKLAYELYKIINPEYYVFQKQVKIECIDEGKVKYTLDALIVEDEEKLGDRFNARIVETGKVMSPSLDKTIYQRMTFFQYMIGNTDWSLPNRHNIEMIKVPENQKIIPLAYDFDYSALVGASYAVPHESLPIKSIFERLYQGHGVSEEDAMATAKYFLEKKPQLLQAVTDCQGLDDKAKNNVNKFLGSFFSIIENEKQVKRTFVQE